MVHSTINKLKNKENKKTAFVKKDKVGLQKSKHLVMELKDKLTETQQEIEQLQKQLNIAFRSTDQLIKRVAELESSKMYKLRKHLSFYTKRLRKNFKTSEKKNYFSLIVNYVLKKGGKATRILSAKILKHTYLLVETKKVVIIEVFTELLATTADYSQYLYRKKISKGKKKYILGEIRKFESKPLLSIVIPVYEPPIDFFISALDSIVNQFYTNWEICLADDCSNDPEVREVIEEYRKKHKNIKVIYREENGHISQSSNSALELATGDYVVLMDQDDILREDALYEIAKAIIQNPSIDMIYSDEDKIDENGLHSEPHFKPDWSPDSLLSRNYLGHVCAFKTKNMRDIGGWRVGFEGSQDYDLVLRYTEKFTSIHHIPEVLYHWRIHRQSAAASETAKPYAYRAAQKALYEALSRRGWDPTIDFLDGFRGYKVRMELKKKDDLVSIIIPTKNKQDYLKKCVDSIVKLSTYRNFEIILIDNNSDDKKFFELVDEWKKQSQFKFKCIRDEESFNFARLMNVGRRAVEGEYIILLNNDTEIISQDWIEGFMEHVQRPEIGVAGCKLLFEDDTIQHAGVVVGLGGVAAHTFTKEDRDGPGYFNMVNLLNNYSALTAACIMVRTKVYDEVGGFSEEFVVEYNDVDFCLKVIEAGYRNLYIPHIELYHYESISRGHPLATSESYKRHVKEVNKFRKKWLKYVEHDPCYNTNLTLGSDNYAIKI